MSYEAARAFADTWGLVFLVVLFAGVIVWVFRRGSGERYRRAARIPMEAQETPPAESPAESDRKINDLKGEVRTAPPATGPVREDQR